MDQGIGSSIFPFSRCRRSVFQVGESGGHAEEDDRDRDQDVTERVDGGVGVGVLGVTFGGYFVVPGAVQILAMEPLVRREASGEGSVGARQEAPPTSTVVETALTVRVPEADRRVGTPEDGVTDRDADPEAQE